MLMDRRTFVSMAAGGALAAGATGSLSRHIRKHPLAITMWDFSWLERRWPRMIGPTVASMPSFEFQVNWRGSSSTASSTPEWRIEKQIVQ